MSDTPQTDPLLVNHTYPVGFYSWNSALRSVYKAGAQARATNRAVENCPYKDSRNWHGGVTWSRSFIRAWLDGWRDRDSQIKEPTTKEPTQ
jgi:ribosome modulation factor